MSTQATRCNYLSVVVCSQCTHVQHAVSKRGNSNAKNFVVVAIL